MNFQDHWSIQIFPEIHMDQWLKVLLYRGIGLWSALLCFTKSIPWTESLRKNKETSV